MARQDDALGNDMPKQKAEPRGKPGVADTPPSQSVRLKLPSFSEDPRSRRDGADTWRAKPRAGARPISGTCVMLMMEPTTACL
jgi:hypothetical protein